MRGDFLLSALAQSTVPTLTVSQAGALSARASATLTERDTFLAAVTTDTRMCIRQSQAGGNDPHPHIGVPHAWFPRKVSSRYCSPVTTSPPARLPAARHTSAATALDAKLTEPSIHNVSTPFG